MQALILFPGNIHGIRANPEGYVGAYLAPRPCGISKFARTPAFCFSLKTGLYRGACLVTVRLNARLIARRASSK